MDIKIVEGLEPWEVMKRASEGEAVALWLPASKQWVDASVCGELKWGDMVAIIDTSTPEIDWDKFDWDFFNQYGGLPVLTPESRETRKQSEHQDLWTNLRESPLYYWPGGEQPVPDGVEVDVVFRDGVTDDNLTRAGKVRWSHLGSIGDIIAFKLTGRLLS